MSRTHPLVSRGGASKAIHVPRDVLTTAIMRTDDRVQRRASDLLDFPSEHPARSHWRRALGMVRSPSMAAAFGCGLVVGGLTVWTSGRAASEPTANATVRSQPQQPR